MKLIFLLPIFSITVLAQDENTTEVSVVEADDVVENATVLPCIDEYDGCALWAQTSPGCDKENIKMNCRKTCNVCSDETITNIVAEKKACKDKDPIVCANIQADPSICDTSERHRSLCPVSCNKCEELKNNNNSKNGFGDSSSFPNLNNPVNTQVEINKLLEQMKNFEEKDDQQLMQEFYTKNTCKDIYPTTCKQLVDFNDDNLSCGNTQIKKLCAVSCNSCDEIIKAFLDKAKEAADVATEMLNKIVNNVDETSEGEEESLVESDLEEPENSSEETVEEKSGDVTGNSSDNGSLEKSEEPEENIEETSDTTEDSDDEVVTEEILETDEEESDVSETDEEGDEELEETDDLNGEVAETGQTTARPTSDTSSSNSLLFSGVVTAIVSLLMI